MEVCKLRVDPGKPMFDAVSHLSGSAAAPRGWIRSARPAVAVVPRSVMLSAARWRGCRPALLIIFLLILPLRLFAQVSATLSGTVTDPSGGAVAGAEITASNLETGAVRTATTGEEGRYEVFAL